LLPKISLKCRWKLRWKITSAGRSVLKEAVGVFDIAFGDEELSGGDVEERESDEGAAGRRSWVCRWRPGCCRSGCRASLRESGYRPGNYCYCRRAACHWWRRRGDHFGDSSFDDAFYGFRVFELIADGYAETGFNELMQVSVEGVMWEPGEFGGGGGSIVAFGQGDPQYLEGKDGVFAKGFVEVAYAE